MKLWDRKKPTNEVSSYEPLSRDFVIIATPLHKDYLPFQIPVRFVMPAESAEDFQCKVSREVDTWFENGLHAVGTRTTKNQC